MSAHPWEAPIYHSMLKHSHGALVSLPPASHTYHSMLKHSRFASLAAKLRVERYVREAGGRLLA